MPLRKSLIPSCHTSDAFSQSVYWRLRFLRSWKARNKDAAQGQLASESASSLETKQWPWRGRVWLKNQESLICCANISFHLSASIFVWIDPGWWFRPWVLKSRGDSQTWAPQLGKDPTPWGQHHGTGSTRPLTRSSTDRREEDPLHLLQLCVTFSSQ